MAYKIYTRGSYFYIVDTVDGRERDGLSKNVRVTKGTTDEDIFYINDVSNWSNRTPLDIADIQDENGDDYLLEDFIKFYEKNTGLKSGEIDTIIQDSTSPTFDLFFVKALAAPTALSVATALDDYTITVDSTVGMAVTPETYLGIFSGTGRFYWGVVLEINGNVLTLDNPLDFEFQIGDNVLPTTRNMRVDGSVTPEVFSIQAGTGGLVIDITRMIYSMITTDPIGLGGFGDGDALLRGCVMRTKNGEYRNLFNFKTNYELGVHCFDVSVYEQAKQTDVNALLARNTYGGQSKRDAVIRLDEGEELQMIVQDDLTLRLLTFLTIAQGSQVVE
jgi:hypothetical protein